MDNFPRCFIVGADNVGSHQMQKIRIALRGIASMQTLDQMKLLFKNNIITLFNMIMLVIDYTSKMHI